MDVHASGSLVGFMFTLIRGFQGLIRSNVQGQAGSKSWVNGKVGMLDEVARCVNPNAKGSSNSWTWDEVYSLAYTVEVSFSGWGVGK
jgi:hypothetical protein